MLTPITTSFTQIAARVAPRALSHAGGLDPCLVFSYTMFRQGSCTSRSFLTIQVFGNVGGWEMARTTKTLFLA